MRHWRSRGALAGVTAALLLLVDWLYKVAVVPRPFWIEHYDAEATYFFQSLRLASGLAPTYIDHPGTPVHLFGAAIVAFTGRSPLAIQPMLVAGYVISLLANLGAILLLRKTLFRNSDPWLWVCGVWTFFIAPTALQYDAIWSAEILFFSAGAVALAAIWKARDGNGSAALAGGAIGLCIAIKVIFGAWLLGLLVLLRPRRWPAALAAAAGAFVAGTLPAANRYRYMASWLWQLATHRGAYGLGPRAAPDVRETIHTIVALAWIAKFWLIWIAALAFLAWRHRHEMRRTTRFVLPASAVSALCVLRAPGPDFHYFLPIALAAIIAVAELPSRYATRLAVLGATLVTVALAQDLWHHTRLVREGTQLRADIDAAVARNAPGGVVLYTWRAPEPSFALQSMTEERRFLDQIATKYPRNGHWAEWHGPVQLPPGPKQWDAVVLNERWVGLFPEPLGRTVTVVPPYRIVLRPGYTRPRAGDQR